jgi:hypothetical protein
MISCCSCWSQPRKDATKSCTEITVRSLRQLPGAGFGHYVVAQLMRHANVDTTLNVSTQVLDGQYAPPSRPALLASTT